MTDVLREPPSCPAVENSRAAAEFLAGLPPQLVLALEDHHVAFGRSSDDVLVELRQAFDSFQAVVDTFIPTATEANPVTPPTFEAFSAFFTEAARSFSVSEAIQIAHDAAIGTSVPDEFAHDVESIAALGSLVDFIKVLHRQNDPHEFNEKRARELLGLLTEDDISERLRSIVLQLAEVGSPYCRPDDFQPSYTLQDLRKKTLLLGLCHLKHAIKLRKKGKCLLLRISDLPEGFFETFGIDLRCMAHWTLKWNPDGSLQPDGRFLLDLKKDPTGSGISLNSDACKAATSNYYGSLSYPSIVDFIRDIANYCATNGYALSDIRMFVEDNKGAFNCLKKAPDDCRLICVRVAVDWLMLPIYGCFGHHGEPFAWDQPAAALDALLHKSLHGVFRRYVDDRFHAAHRDFVAFDHDLVHLLNDLLYGPHALDPDKSQAPYHIIDAIGWTLDVFHGSIRPNSKATKKLVLAFFGVSLRPKAKWPLPAVQALASLASRYSLALVGMRPFVQPFNAMLAAEVSVPAHLSRISRAPSSAARFAVTLWRAVAIALWCDPLRLAVPMFSLLPERHDEVAFRPFTDAADRLGLRMFNSSGDLLTWCSYPFPFITPEARLAFDPSYQNSREFMGVIGSLLVLRLHFRAPPGTVISWTNDNRSAISWVRDNVARSLFAQVAFTAYSWMCIVSGYIVAEQTHAPASTAEMVRVDELSRNRNMHLHDPALSFNLAGNPLVDQLFLLLDPVRVHESPAALASTFAAVSSIIHLLFASH